MFNFTAVLVSALVPLVIGFIWYNPKVFGTIWMHSIGVTDEQKMKEGAKMGLIFTLSLVFSFLLALSVPAAVIHQMGLESLLMNDKPSRDAVTEIFVNGKKVDYINNFRTFKHGSFHGVLMGIFMILPVIATNALYEKKGFKYIAVTAGYWIVSLGVMGGIISAWQ
jgi:hypothetical protein